MPGFHAGHPPRNKGVRYPADPPTVEEIVAVMRIAGDGLHGRRLRGLVAVLWRAGLRIDEALALHEADLDRRRGSLPVRHGKGGRRREVGMDDWAWQELEPWLTARVTLPVGPLFCIINGRTRGRPWTTSGARAELGRAAARAGVRRRFAPHQLRHAHAGRDGPRRRPADRHPAPARPQQPRHHLGLSAGHRHAEIIETVHARRAPMIPVSASPRS
jgi:integrase